MNKRVEIENTTHVDQKTAISNVGDNKQLKQKSNIPHETLDLYC